MRLRLLLIVFLVACETPAGVGTPCARGSECAAGLACTLGRCRVACVESRDCPLGAECVPVGAGGACRLATDVCSVETDCEPPLVCGADGACRASCLADEDCRGARCVLSGGRTVCVLPDADGDGGVDDAGASDAGETSCPIGTSSGFANGLDGWCIETSPGLSADVVTAVATGDDGHAARIDLGAAPIGSWVRLYQEGPLDLTDYAHMRRFDAELTGGVAIAPLELVAADGTLLGRIAGYQAGSGTSDCSETGRVSTLCVLNTTGFDASALSAAVATAGVDPRDVARVRRVAELVRTTTGPLAASIDGTWTTMADCPAAWWRFDTTLASLDLEHLPTLGAGVRFSPTGRMLVFPIAVCGNALRFDGTQWIERDTPLPAGPYTVSTFWHGPTGGELIPDGGTLFEAGASDAHLFVRGGRLVASSGTCPGGGARLEAVDPTPLGTVDRRFQEAQVVLDAAAPRLCLVRDGRTVACDTTEACAVGARGTGLRLGAGLEPDTGFIGGLDELRLEAGDQGPRDATARSGRCYVDRVCSDFDRALVRDTGSDECLAASDCTTLWLCPDAARTPGFACSALSGRIECTLDMSCPAISGACTGGCPPHYSSCLDQLSVDRASCP